MLTPPAADQRLRVCVCPDPVESADPRTEGMCNRCLGAIAKGTPWEITDDTHNAFLDRVESTLRAAEGWPRDEPPPAAWLYFRQLALEREQDGRKRFGPSYLWRDNTQAGTEEDSDGLNYLWFDLLKTLRERRSEEWAEVLEVAYYSYKTYAARLRLKAKRAGAP